MPSNEGEGDGIKSRLLFKIFSTLQIQLLGMLSNPDPVDDMESLDEGTKADDENDSTDKNNQTSGESDLEKGSEIMCGLK